MAFKTLQNMFPQLVGTVYDEMPEANSASDGAPVLVKDCRNEYTESKFIYDRICALPRMHLSVCWFVIIARHSV